MLSPTRHILRALTGHQNGGLWRPLPAANRRASLEPMRARAARQLAYKAVARQCNLKQRCQLPAKIPFIQIVKLRSIENSLTKAILQMLASFSKPYCNNKQARAHRHAKTNKQTTNHAKTIRKCSTLRHATDCWLVACSGYLRNVVLFSGPPPCAAPGRPSAKEQTLMRDRCAGGGRRRRTARPQKCPR